MRGWSVGERMKDVISTRVRDRGSEKDYSESDYEGLELGGEFGYPGGELPSVHEISPFIDEIEEVLCTAARVPLSSKALVDQERCLATLDALRANWPLEVLEAQRVLARQGDVLERAEMEAEQTRERAERQASLILDQGQLARMAEVRAQEVMEAAQHDAVRIRERAEQDARDVYEGLERELDLLMRDIKQLVAARLRRLKS